MKIKALFLSSSFLFGAAVVLPACGSSSPDNYIEKTTQLGCKYLKKCEESMWDEAGFDSVNDCRDESLDLELVPGTGTVRDLFVEACSDFDKSAARKCLAASRKAVRSCDQELEMEDQTTCAEVCGDPAMGSLLRDPTNQEVVFELLEQMEADGQLELVDGEYTLAE